MRFELAIPDPCMVVLVGAAGSGKSTFAARHFATAEILSSDTFRAQLGRDEADQAASRRAFGALHAAVERRLADGRTTVVDATNVLADARHALLRRAAAAGVPAVAIVLDLPLGACLAGDRERPGRHVADAVIERQWAALQAALRSGDVDSEGFLLVHRLPSWEAVDALVLRRTVEGWPTLSRASRRDRPP